MKPKRILPLYVLNEDIGGFYGSRLESGSLLYSSPHNDGIPIRIGRYCSWRFVFDTVEGAQSHKNPPENKRCAIWFTKGKFEYNITPYNPTTT